MKVFVQEAGELLDVGASLLGVVDVAVFWVIAEWVCCGMDEFFWVVVLGVESVYLMC